MLKSTILIASAATALMFAPTSPSPADARVPADGKEFVVDGLHSSAIFRIQHLKSAQFYGRFNEIEGSFMVDEDNPKKSFFDVTISVASVDTNDEKRDSHLKSSDFFAAKEHPTITLKSTKVKKTSDDTYYVAADLTMRGNTARVDFEVRHTGTANLIPQFGLRTGYEAEIEIDRTDFGMTYYAKEGALGKMVKIIVSIEGKLPE